MMLAIGAEGHIFRLQCVTFHREVGARHSVRGLGHAQKHADIARALQRKAA